MKKETVVTRATLRRLTAVSLILAAGSVWAETAPIASYAGQQQRAIKSLSESDVAGLLAGHGAGYAKAAELNGYPGPAHVLELAQELHLTKEQAEATRALRAQHQVQAARLGAGLVEAEQQLDSVFADGRATPAAVDEAAARVGVLQAQLRAEHLKTHIAQTSLLTPHQVHRYASLRGYDDSGMADRTSPTGMQPAKPLHSNPHSTTHSH